MSRIDHRRLNESRRAARALIQPKRSLALTDIEIEALAEMRSALTEHRKARLPAGLTGKRVAYLWAKAYEDTKRKPGRRALNEPA